MVAGVVAVLALMGGAMYSVLDTSTPADAERHRRTSLTLLSAALAGLVAGGLLLAAYG